MTSELNERIEKGSEIRDRRLSSDADLNDARADFYTWDDYNTELLKQRFTTSEIADDYSHLLPYVGGGPLTAADKIRELQGDIDRKLRKLMSIGERLPLFQEPTKRPVFEERPAAAARAAASIPA
jgi:hypothetical protein